VDGVCFIVIFWLRRPAIRLLRGIFCPSKETPECYLRQHSPLSDGCFCFLSLNIILLFDGAVCYRLNDTKWGEEINGTKVENRSKKYVTLWYGKEAYLVESTFVVCILISSYAICNGKMNVSFCNTVWKNHCVSVLCPSSGILNNHKTQRFGNWICFRLQVRANFNHWTPKPSDSEFYTPWSENFWFFSLDEAYKNYQNRAFS
jgi:hypothetical protein